MDFRVTIPAGAEVQIGQPSHPNRKLARSIARLLISYPEVREAHFPQCFVPSLMSRPAQVLMLLFEEVHDISQAIARVNDGLTRLVTSESYVDVWPISAGDSLMQSIRNVGCKIFERTPSGKAVTYRPWSAWNRLLRTLHRGWHNRRMSG